MRHLREARGQTQKRLADASGVPRPTIANLESGSANPTLSVLVRVASALQVSIGELIGPPRASARLYKRHEIPEEIRQGVVIRPLVPDTVPGLHTERMAIPPGVVMKGTPHTPGTREYLTCEAGEVRLSAAGQSWLLSPGDVLVFRGDQPHSYANRGNVEAIAYAVVLLVPVPDAA